LTDRNQFFFGTNQRRPLIAKIIDYKYKAPPERGARTGIISGGGEWQLVIVVEEARSN
jgi:hypothetical protein